MDMEMDADTDTIFFVSVRTETNQKSICFGSVTVVFTNLKIISACVGVSEQFQTKQKKIDVSKKPKLKINTLLRRHGLGHFSIVLVCFEWSLGVSVIETPKQAVSILNWNNRNKRLVSDIAETSFDFSFDDIETKLLSQDTLLLQLPYIQCYKQITIQHKNRL